MKLVTLSGTRDTQINPNELNPIDRGILFLSHLTEMYPNLTWGDLSQLSLSGWLADKFSDIKDYDYGGTIKTAATKVQNLTQKLPSVIATEKIKTTVQQYLLSKAKGKDATNAINDVFANSGMQQDDKINLLSSFGDGLKDYGINPKYLAIGIAGLITVVLIRSITK